MDEFEIKVDMLLSSLEKKREALNVILNITENQNLVLSDRSNPAYAAMFNEMNVIKQENIDAVIEMDSLFQGVFGGISDGFEQGAENCKTKVSLMQDIITEVLETDIKIRAAEQRNRVIADEIRRTVNTPDTPPPKSQPNATTRNHLLKQYEKNKKNNG